MAKKKKRKKKATRSASSSIPNAELDVLSCVWREGPVTARRIREMMKKYRPMAHGSVVTLLTRLEEKGLVGKKKGPVGKAFLFSSKKDPGPTHRKLAKDLLHRVFADNVADMVAALFAAETPTQDELATIQKLVSATKKKARKKRR